MEDHEILEGVLDEFGKLAAIPRKSGHEKKVSDFLRGYLADLGLRVVQDEVFNIIADQAATRGFEHAPLTILQGHMDMVCIAEHGHAYDPLKDPVKLRRTEEYLEAEGTSLGADDGIGVAEAVYIMKHAEKHGPLRLVVTVDEEAGMKGAAHLDKRYLEDARFLINCDSENFDELVVGSAGNASIDFVRRINYVPLRSKQTWRLGVKGLKGGHSGERIGDGRGNAIRLLASALRALLDRGTVELVSFDGGKARNAIPSDAAAIFATDIPEAEIRDTLVEQEQRFLRMYSPSDEAHFLLEETGMAGQAFSEEDALCLLRLIRILHSGVYAMSQIHPGLVETSMNLGTASTGDGLISLECLPRSSKDEAVEEFCRTAEDMAALAGFSARIATKSPGWQEKKDSVLTKLVAETFHRQTGKSMRIAPIHAGLECGWYFRKNPELDIVSIGPTTLNIHSPRERLVLSTVTPQVRLIDAVLRRIAEMKEGGEKI